MLKFGELQTLIAVRRSEYGMYLAEKADTDRNASTVLLPNNQTPRELSPGDPIEVFLYRDSEDRLIATTTVPALTLGGLAVLPVKEVSRIGAFLSWGLTKDLMLPFREQTYHVQAGDYVLVSLYIDKSSRLCATMKVYSYLETNAPYQKEEMVSGIVYELSQNLGAFVAVDNRYSALIPKQELFRPLTPGEQISARVSDIREDGKLTLSLRDKSYLQIQPDAVKIEEKLKANNGFLPFHDKSSADAIKAEFSLSKNAFKRAVGHLLKEGKITLEENGIRLLSPDGSFRPL